MKMSNRIVVAFKNQIVIAFIVVGASIIAVPIIIFGLIRNGWKLGTFWAAPKRAVASEQLRRVLETIETSIGPQTDKRTKSDSSTRQGTEMAETRHRPVAARRIAKLYSWSFHFVVDYFSRFRERLGRG